MGQMLRMRSGRDVDLGGALELIQFYGELGRLLEACGQEDEYPTLLSLVNFNEEPQPYKVLAQLKAEAKKALKDGLSLSEHGTWILRTLAGMRL